MAQTNYTPISLYYSTTASAVPTAANLVPGELAINTNDGKLYYEDSSGVVRVLASKSTGTVGGSTTQVQFNNSGSLGGSSGLTWDGSFLTTSSIKNSALTSGRVTYAGASGLLKDISTFVFDGTNLGVGTGSPVAPLNLVGASTSTSTPLLYLQQGGSFPGYGYTFAIDNQTTGSLLLRRYGDNTNTDLGTLLTVASNGNLGLGVAPACILDISGSSGGQIKFPATQNASSNANTLDDYEEGTWTPTIAGDGTEFVGATYNSRAGKYVKIGDVVWVSFDIDVLLAGVLLNNASVGGLPFAIPNASNLSNGGGGIGYITGIQQNYVYQSLYPSNNSSYLFIIGRTAASTSTTPPTSANFYANSTRLTGWAWWRTTV